MQCKICKQNLVLEFDDDFKKKFHSKATHYPYPVVFPHDKHWAILYLDHDLNDRGVIFTDLTVKKYKENNSLE